MDITAKKRPEPAQELTADQAHEWRAVVNRMPADWFGEETHALLAQYCRHVVTASYVAGLIENLLAVPDFHLESYNKLLIMQEREGRALSALATRMRITQHAQFSRNRRTGA